MTDEFKKGYEEGFAAGYERGRGALHAVPMMPMMPMMPTRQPNLQQPFHFHTCACPPGLLCGNSACPRALKTTCGAGVSQGPFLNQAAGQV